MASGIMAQPIRRPRSRSYATEMPWWPGVEPSQDQEFASGQGPRMSHHSDVKDLMFFEAEAKEQQQTRRYARPSS